MYSVRELSKVSICCTGRVKGGGGVCEVLIQPVDQKHPSFMILHIGSRMHERGAVFHDRTLLKDF